MGRPEDRFGEDGLRVLRAARFVATLEFELDAAHARARSRRRSTHFGGLPERVRDEWLSTLTRARRRAASR